MRTVPCPDCGRPAAVLGRFIVDGTAYVRLRCSRAPGAGRSTSNVRALISGKGRR